MLLGFSSATGGEATYSNSVAHDKTLFGSNYTSADSIALQYEMMGMNNTYLGKSSPKL